MPCDSPHAQRLPDVPLTIVGAGPVGLTLANLLGHFGVQTLVLEKDSLTPDTPRAVALDDESLRIWQQCCLIDQILPFVAQGEEGDEVFTYRARDGQPIFALKQRGRPYGYARGNTFLFHRVLDVLRDGLGRYSHVELRRGWQVTEFAQEADQVLVRMANRAGETMEIATDFLIGCDGGQSTVRRGLGIEMTGKNFGETWLIADTRDPSRAGQPPAEGVEVWCDAECPTASIPMPDGYRRWEFLPRGETSHPSDPDRIEHLIRQRKPEDRSEIQRHLSHTYKCAIATNYRKGRVFLAGDAAHLSPPFAGQGMATGLRDAANLAWKIALVVAQKAPLALLDSYEQERRPHQLKMLQLARTMGRVMMPRQRSQEWLMRTGLTLAYKFPPLREKFEIRGPNITPIYPAKRSHRRSRAGHYLLQPLVGARPLDALLGRFHTVVGFERDPATALPENIRESWRGQELHFLQLPPTGETLAAWKIFDQWLKGSTNRLLIIRPDRFVLEDIEL